MTAIKKKLTADAIKKAAPNTEMNDKGVIPDAVIRDTEIPGLFLRVTPNGSKSLLVRYRVGKGRGAPIRQPRLPFDTFTPQDVAQARKLAHEWRTKGAEGIDVGKELRAEAQAPTMAGLAKLYMERHGHDKRSGDEDERRLSSLPQSLLRTRVKDVTKEDIRKLHRSGEKHPYSANRLLALLSTMFNLAIDWELAEKNPALGISKFEEEKRERFLSEDEIDRLNSALDAYATERGDRESAEAADAIRLLLLTGCRVGELMSATWDQFDLEAGVWTKPSAHTKQKKIHRVTLSAPAVGILEGIRARFDIPGRWVFPGRQGGHRLSIKRAWRDVRTRAGLADVRIHDLRHSAASLMLSAGVPLDIIGRVLGHTQAQTTLRYAHLTDDASKKATDALGDVIAFGRK